MTQIQDWKEIRRGDSAYPQRLMDYGSMPDRLYVRGNLPEEGPSVAIVGARKCSIYGKRQAYLFGKVLAQNGISIISGMARGIDAAAQKGALDGGGKSYAVLGCGVDICYPESNRSLYDALPLHGGILSEYEPGSKPLSWHFPIRNRIISALADIVLVIEARKKSGSLITVDYALEQGKTVFALPGRAGDSLSDGCNLLIAQGAGIACSPECILEELDYLYAHCHEKGENKEDEGSESDSKDNDGDSNHFIKQESRYKVDRSVGNISVPERKRLIPEDLTPAGKIMIKALTEDLVTLDELMVRTSLSPEKAMEAITELLFMGEAEEPYPHLYVRA